MSLLMPLVFRPGRRLVATVVGVVCLAATLALVPRSAGQEPPAPEESGLLTIDRIFASGDLHAEGPPSIRWSDSRPGYTMVSEGDLAWFDAASGKKEVLVPSQRFVPRGDDRAISVESYALSSDQSKLLIFTHSKRVWRTRPRGDYWVLDIAGGQLTRLGGDAPPSSLMFATFSPDGTKAAYVRDNDLYVQNLGDSRITRLTNDGSPLVSNGAFDWVYEEELSLHNGFRWSPDGQSIAFWQIDARETPQFPLVKSLGGLYPSVQWIPYPKVGQRNPSARIGVVSAGGGAIRWLELPGDPREHYLAQLDWASDSQLILQQFNRLQNTNHLILADAATLSHHTLLTETDSAWVENSNSSLHWVTPGETLVWLSERDGWQHAYLVSLADGAARLITPGAYDVLSIEHVDAAGQWLYFIASPENPTQRYLYRVKLDGADLQRLSPADRPGTHSYSISPEGAWALHSWSSISTPPVVEIISLPDHKTVRSITDNVKLKEKLAKLKLPAVDLFRIEASPGVVLDGWRIKPPEMDPQKKHPLLVYVYGEPAGQTVLDRWPGQTGYWHWMLAQQGYVVVSFDNRGTPAPRGREWRKSIYRQVGVLASADQAGAVQRLVQENAYLDGRQVGVWGWSGGGSMTLNCLFRYPDVFHVGVSIAPVPNQRLYDTIYQERYMGLPDDNAEGYRLGSPLSFASQLQGELLLVHGTADDNCHFQGTEALIHDLIAANKQFSMFSYPDRSHSISEGKNTTRHLFQQMTNFLQDKLKKQ